ncbi:MAG: hypothetical protein IJ237_06610 [Oscillospiraceae bacterium]|nr:hypothetical protein [Oscillospiraceae bacterium]
MEGKNTGSRADRSLAGRESRHAGHCHGKQNHNRKAQAAGRCANQPELSACFCPSSFFDAPVEFLYELFRCPHG